MRRETFRAGVGLLVLDSEGRVLALERTDLPGEWQLPQGGLEVGEELAAAAWRELEEETGLSAEQVALGGPLGPWLGYELPEPARSGKTGRGQVHRWFFFYFRDGAVLPPLPGRPDAEFRDRRWMTMAELIGRTVEFRRPVYRTLQEELGRLR